MNQPPSTRSKSQSRSNDAISLAYLEACPFLAGVPNLSELVSGSTLEECRRGAVLYKSSSQEGRPALWVVVWGLVEVIDSKGASRLCGPHSLFGEEELLSAARLEKVRAKVLERTLVLKVPYERISALTDREPLTKALQRANKVYDVAASVVGSFSTHAVFSNVRTADLFQLLEGAERIHRMPGAELLAHEQSLMKEGQVPEACHVLLKGAVRLTSKITHKPVEQWAPCVLGAEELLFGEKAKMTCEVISRGEVELVRLSGKTLLQAMEVPNFRRAIFRTVKNPPKVQDSANPEVLVLLPCEKLLPRWGEPLRRSRVLAGLTELLAEQMASQLCDWVRVIHVVPQGRVLPEPIKMPVEDARPLGNLHGFLPGESPWVEYCYVALGKGMGVVSCIQEAIRRFNDQQDARADLTLIDLSAVLADGLDIADVLVQEKQVLSERTGLFGMVFLMTSPDDVPPHDLLALRVRVIPTAVIDVLPPGGFGHLLAERHKYSPFDNFEMFKKVSRHMLQEAGKAVLLPAGRSIPPVSVLGNPEDEDAPEWLQSTFKHLDKWMSSLEPWPAGTVRVHFSLALLGALGSDSCSSPVRLSDLELQEPEQVRVVRTFGRWGRGITGRRIGLALGGGGPYGKAHAKLIRGLNAAGIPIDMISGSSAGATAGAYYAVCDEAGLTAFEQHFDFLILFASGLSILSSVFFEWAMLLELGFARVERSEIPFFSVVTDAHTGLESDVRSGTYAFAVRASGSLPPLGPTVFEDRRFLDGGLVANVPINVLRQESAGFVIASNPIASVPHLPRQRPLRIPVLGTLLAELNPVRRFNDIVRMIPMIFQTTGKAQEAQADVVYTADANKVQEVNLSLAVAEARVKIRHLFSHPPARVHLRIKDDQPQLTVNGNVQFLEDAVNIEAHCESLLEELATEISQNANVHVTVCVAANSKSLAEERAHAVVEFLETQKPELKDSLSFQGEEGLEDGVRFVAQWDQDATIKRLQAEAAQANLNAQIGALLVNADKQLYEGSPDNARLLVLDAVRMGSSLRLDQAQAQEQERILRRVLACRSRTVDTWKAIPGEGKPVMYLAFDSQGELLATGCDDGLVRVWNLGQEASGNRDAIIELQSSRGSVLGIRSVVWSPNGRLLATAGFHHPVRIHDKERGFECTDGISSSPWDVGGLSFARDGKRLVGTGACGKSELAVMEVSEEGRLSPPCRLRAGDGAAFVHAALSPCGQQLAAVTDNGQLLLWEDLKDGAEPRVLGRQLRSGFRVVWSPPKAESSWLAVASAAGLWVWRADAAGSGESLLPLDFHVGAVRDVCWSPDGSRLLSVGDGGLACIWKIKGDTFKLKRVVQGSGEPFRGCAWQERGSLAVAWSEGSVTVFNPYVGQVLAQHQSPGRAKIFDVAWRPGTEELAIAHADATICLWDPVFSGQLSFQRKLLAPSLAAWCPRLGAALVLTITVDGSIALWDAAQGKLLPEDERPGRAWAAWSPDGRCFATIREGDSKPQVVAAPAPDGGEAVASLPKEASGALDGPVWISFSPDGKWLAVRQGQQFSFWAVENREVDLTQTPKVFDAPCKVHFAEWRPDSAQLAVALWRSGPAVALVNPTSPQRPLFLEGHRDGVWCVSYSPDNRWIATACNDSQVRIYEVAASSWRPVAQLARNAAVRSVAWHPEGGFLGVGDTASGATVWKVELGEDARGLPELTQVCCDEVQSGTVDLLVWSGNGEFLAAKNVAGPIRVWSETPGYWVEVTSSSDHHGVMTWMAFSPDGKSLLATSEDGRAISHPVGFENLVQAVEALPGCPSTAPETPARFEPQEETRREPSPRIVRSAG